MQITEINDAQGKTPIFSLSFGDGADKNFLQKLSLHNNGFSRHIYEAADASLQLEEFYKQISSPLLSNVTFKYTPSVSNLTKTNFPILFGGGELVVSGKVGKSVFKTLKLFVQHTIFFEEVIVSVFYFGKIQGA